MKPVIVRNLAIGEGIPKTIVSLMGATAQDAIKVGEHALAAGADCLEWRADFCSDALDLAAMKRSAETLRNALPDAPLLFTFRTAGQGGQIDLSAEQYADLTAAMIETGIFDLVDIESWIGSELVSSLAKTAHEKEIAVIVSHHDFDKTPPKKWMLDEMLRMLEMGADIPKIAVMATSAADTLELLCATEEMRRFYGQGPIITMAMGRWGTLSRLAGEAFGSSMTFCALESASAPGQVDLELARSLMNDIHNIQNR